MNNWRDLFQDHILARGEMYYYDGAVQELQKTEHGYHAVVEGTEDYEVDIEMEDGQIYEMYCTCPYAEDGNNCKHMATGAVLLITGMRGILPVRWRIIWKTKRIH